MSGGGPVGSAAWVDPSGGCGGSPEKEGMPASGAIGCAMMPPGKRPCGMSWTCESGAIGCAMMPPGKRPCGTSWICESGAIGCAMMPPGKRPSGMSCGSSLRT